MISRAFALEASGLAVYLQCTTLSLSAAELIFDYWIVPGYTLRFSVPHEELHSTISMSSSMFLSM